VATEFSLTGQVRLDPRWVDDLNTTVVTDSVRLISPLTFVNGDGAGEADGYWKEVVTVPGEGSEALDLTDLRLDVFGGVGALDLAAVKVLAVRNTSESVIEVALGASVTGEIEPGGLLVASSPVAGWAESTLTLTNPDQDAADVEVYLIGVQAT
jgi:hypothetical protein